MADEEKAPSYDRRDFVKAGAVAAVATSLASSSAQAQPAAPTASRYQAHVPDTLDLAARGALALRALTNSADSKFLYETCQGAHLDHQTPYMSWRTGGPCLQKPIHALPGLRLMSGSTVNADVDAKMMEAVISTIDDDGLWWLNVENRPWRKYFQVDQSWPVAHARLMVALLEWHKLDGDNKWLEMVGRMSDGLARIAETSEDRAWYYTALARSGEWWGHVDAHAGSKKQAVTAEPDALAFYAVGLPLRAFSHWYAVSGDKKALAMSQKLARYMLKSQMWTAQVEGMITAAEHGRWSGHFHTHTMGLIGLLEYGIASGDAHVRRVAEEAYLHARSVGISRIGFFPAQIRPPQQKQASDAGASGTSPQVSETCGVADMIALAIRLSQSGMGDYWDDVDQYTRNHLVECQMLRRDLLEEIIAAGPEYNIDPTTETADNVLERNIGAFVSGSDPTWLYTWYTMCCQGNAALALYEAWKAILDHTDGVVQVNLLLNRASPWMDIDSYLPYEGKVLFKNKTARKLHARVPSWVDKKAVRCRVGSREVSPHWLGNYVIVEGLKPSDVVQLEFPVPTSSDTFTLPSYQRKYNCEFRGSTLVDIDPRGERPALLEMGSDDGGNFEVRKGYPIYLRDHMKADRAPMKTIERYAADKLG